MDHLRYTQGPTGPTRIAVIMPRVVLRVERRTQSMHVLDGFTWWRDWSWGLSLVGCTAFRFDIIGASLHLAGDVLDVPVRVELGMEIRRGFVAPVCPMCRRGLASDGLLTARVVGSVQMGCTRCVAPPPNDEAPSPAEVRAALEALSRRSTSSDARRGAGRRGGGC